MKLTQVSCHREVITIFCGLLTLEHHAGECSSVHAHVDLLSELTEERIDFFSAPSLAFQNQMTMRKTRM